MEDVICSEFKDTVVINKKTQSSIGIKDSITNTNNEAKIKVDSSNKDQTELNGEKICESNSSDVSVGFDKYTNRNIHISF